MKKITACILTFCLVCSFLLPVSAKAADLQPQMEKLLSMLEIMQGYPDGNFYPEYDVTRAEFAKIAIAASDYRSSVSKTSQTSPFQDVPYTYWGASYVKVAVANKLMKGYPDATFRPEENVLLEEAVTVCLKLLGYTDEDFGSAWPEGQMNKAASLELLDGVDKSIGESMTRGEVMTLIYNTLNTVKKGSQTKQIDSFGYQIIEDVVLIATTAEDPSVAKDKIVTSEGTYKLDESFDPSFVGKKADIVLKDGDTLVAVFPSEMTSISYGVYSTLNDDIVAYEGSSTKLLDLDENMTAYYKSQKGTLNSFLPSVKQGYMVTIYSNYLGNPDYIVISDRKMLGPVVVEDANWINNTNLDQSGISVLKDGVPATLADIQTYDVVYYSETLNTVWAYSKKVTGVYDKATPSKEQVSTVTISGVSYDLETIEAFNQLGPGGEFNLNDTVTLLLGRDGKVVKALGAGAVKTDRYIVYSKLANDVIVYKDGVLSQLDMDLNTMAYFNGQQSTLRSVISSMETGHILSVVYNADNTVDYVTVDSKKIEGPYTVTGGNWSANVGIQEGASYLRDGNSVDKSALQPNDIIYYSSSMNVVWAYSKKVTGVYEKASPNKDSLTSVTISGTSYTVESVTAFNKLASGGAFSYGDTVTLLLGKDGQIADVVAPDEDYNIYGYVMETGTKEFQNSNDDTYTANYIKIMAADGTEYVFRTEKDQKNYLCNIVNIRLNDGVANVTGVQKATNLSGEVLAKGKRIGSKQLSEDIGVLDVTTTDRNATPGATTVFLQRLDGVTLIGSDVLFYTQNDKNEIDRLFLDNVTGDAFEYGIVTSARSTGSSMSAGGTYVCDIDGITQTLSTSGVSYPVSSGEVAKFTMQNGKISGIYRIQEIDSPIVRVDELNVYTKTNKSYALSDKVKVYHRTQAGVWKIIPLKQLIENKDDLTIHAYYDNLPEFGGRIRVLIGV